MRLCLDARMLHASGIGVYLQNIIPTLSKKFELILIGHTKELEKYDAQIIHYEAPIYSLAALIKLPLLIPSCDIFWSPHYNIPLFPIRAKKRLVTIHDVFHLAFMHTLSFQQKIYAKLLSNAAAHLSDQVITVSQFSKEEIVKYTHCSSDKISVIYNGINHEHFQPINDPRLLRTVSEKYKLPKAFILFVGNVKPHKNLIGLVKAFDRIKDQFPELSLVVVGKKEGFITNDNDVLNHIAQNKSLEARVHFTGFVEDADLPAIYNLASLFVFPSLYEGFGLPPLEAMACGCPVLVSDQACMPEVCGDQVAYTHPANTDQMAEDIKNILNASPAEKQKMMEEGLQIATNFRWKQSIEKHIQLLTHL